MPTRIQAGRPGWESGKLSRRVADREPKRHEDEGRGDRPEPVKQSKGAGGKRGNRIGGGWGVTGLQGSGGWPGGAGC